MSKEAAEYGADGLLLVTPYYNKATQAGLIAHYTAVAKEVKTPIIMYSVASRTGCNIEAATVAALVNQRSFRQYRPGGEDHGADRREYRSVFR